MKLFEQIEEKNIPPMLHCLGAVQKTYFKGEFIINEGEEIKNIGIIKSGSINLIKDDFEGKKNIICKILPNETFLESYACLGIEKSPISIEVCEKTVCLLMNLDKILSVCEKFCPFHKQLIKNLVKIIAQKNIELNLKLELLGQESIRKKILYYICEQKNKTFKQSFSQTELAQYLNVNRSALSREISKMKKEGIGADL